MLLSSPQNHRMTNFDGGGAYQLEIDNNDEEDDVGKELEWTKHNEDWSRR